MKKKWEGFWAAVRHSSYKVRLSAVIMGCGQFLYGSRIKGVLYFLAELILLGYFVVRGFDDIAGFFALGTTKGDAWLGIEGDNSVVMLLMGIFAWIVVAVFLSLYVMNVKGAYQLQLRIEDGREVVPFRRELAQLLDKKFYVTVLILPVLGVCVFNILPIIFMILIAFTNYGGEIVPPELVDWIGLDNFKKLVTLTQFAPTFFKILVWNLIWAVASTALNYFAGLGLALLLDKKCVKGKAFWRAFPVLAYAIPGFITLVAFKFMLPILC